jgi:tetratricopeptide (TPR) repeat protein
MRKCVLLFTMRSWPGLLLLVTLVVALGGLSIRRSMVYVDGLTLWTDVVAKAPDKARPLTFLGLEYQKKFDENNARMYFERAVEQQPDFPEALNNLGNLYGKAGDYPRALELLRRAVDRAPRSLAFRSNLAITYFSASMPDDAAREYLGIVHLAPQSTESSFARLMLREIEKAKQGR